VSIRPPFLYEKDTPEKIRLSVEPVNLRAAPRCGAKTRAGTLCRCPAICGHARCRIHGGLSPGAPRGDQNGNYVDGHYTAEAVRERRWAKSLLDTFGKDKSHG
jgi:hypothetical protein